MKTKNSVFVITPFLDRGMWVFDDSDRAIVHEPFVAGIPEMIDHFTKGIKGAEEGFTLLFSDSPIPGFQAHLTLKEAGDRNWSLYTLKGSKKEGWLCPVLLEYFPEPPQNIYCVFQPLRKVTRKISLKVGA